MVNNSASLEELEARRLDLQRARMRLDSELTATNWELAGEQTARDGYAPASQTRTASTAAPSPPPRPKEPLWGKMVRGVKTIVKWVVIAAVAYAAFQVGTGFLSEAYPNFYANISTGATELWKSISSTVVDTTKAASEWVGQLFSQNAAGAGTGLNFGHAATTGALTAGAVGTAVYAKQATAHHATTSADTSNLVGNFPEEIAVTGAEKLAAKYSVAANHAAADHSSHYAMKAAHVSTDQTLERLDHRAANLHASKVQSAAERVLNARQNAHSWAEHVDSSRPVGPKGVA